MSPETQLENCVYILLSLSWSYGNEGNRRDSENSGLLNVQSEFWMGDILKELYIVASHCTGSTSQHSGNSYRWRKSSYIPWEIAVPLSLQTGDLSTIAIMRRLPKTMSTHRHLLVAFQMWCQVSQMPAYVIAHWQPACCRIHVLIGPGISRFVVWKC